MKKSKKFFSVLVVLLPIVLILNIYYSIPSKIIITQNSDYSFKLNNFCSADKTKIVSAGKNALLYEKDNETFINTNNCGEFSLPVRLLNIPVKEIEVTVAPQQYVVPSGDTIGIKMYTEGLLIVNISEFTASDGSVVSPAKACGLEKGDRITAVDGTAVNTSEELLGFLSAENPTLVLTVVRESSVFTVEVTAAAVENEEKPKLGMWVRDSTAGIGTLTYYDPKNSSFAALGHAICDPDTGDIMRLRKGSIYSCNILSVVKGEHGSPGELVGSFGTAVIGTIRDNNELGIYGSLENFNHSEFSQAVEVATRFQIKEGDAEILADIDGKGVKSYSVKIEKVSKSTRIDNKGLVIKVTDDTLIAKTGGIVQGMSGCPILQNNRLIGAVTHVFVNDPTKGYGIFAENLLNSTNATK